MFGKQGKIIMLHIKPTEEQIKCVIFRIAKTVPTEVFLVEASLKIFSWLHLCHFIFFPQSLAKLSFFVVNDFLHGGGFLRTWKGMVAQAGLDVANHCQDYEKEQLKKRLSVTEVVCSMFNFVLLQFYSSLKKLKDHIKMEERALTIFMLTTKVFLVGDNSILVSPHDIYKPHL